MAMRREWNEGRKAAEQGKCAEDDCPYEFGTDAMEHWLKGYGSIHEEGLLSDLSVDLPEDDDE